MSDAELAHDILVNILTAIERIERRFAGIECADDFVTDDEGIDRLDAIAMMLIAIGEQVKRLEPAIGIDLAAHYPQVDWKGVKGIRDFLSHHYFIIDAEVIYDVCRNKLSDLKRAVLDMLSA
jgi:uncharacterized protein with HEPN domain